MGLSTPAWGNVVALPVERKVPIQDPLDQTLPAPAPEAAVVSSTAAMPPEQTTTVVFSRSASRSAADSSALVLTESGGQSHGQTQSTVERADAAQVGGEASPERSANQAVLASAIAPTCSSADCAEAPIAAPEVDRLTEVSTQASDLAQPQPELVAQPRFSRSPSIGSRPDAPAAPVATPENQRQGTPPTAIAPDALSPVVTSIPVDGELIEAEQTGRAAIGVQLGNDRSTNLGFSGRVVFDRTLESSTTVGNVSVLRQSQRLLRGQTVLRQRQLSISRQDPVTVLGQQIQTTLLADCLDGSGAVCTFTPGLVTDRDRIDPDTLQPTQIDQTSNVGDVVSPASLAAIQAPGFQGGAEGQALGLDLYFPNTTTLAGNSRAAAGTAQRYEQFDTVPAIAYSEIFQTVVANANQAALARTIRGPAVVLDADQPVINLALAAIALLLPEVQPFVPDSDAPSNPNLNQGLFFAANNTRIPANSLTLYQAGVGHSATPAETSQNAPWANFNAVWLGLSPVTERSYQASRRFANVGPPRTLFSAGGEGGSLNAPQVLSVVNGETFASSSLSNAYTQNYFTLFAQEGDRLDRFVQSDRISYHPHLSLTGNVTGESSIFRYYAGTLAGPTLQAYGGANVQGQTTDGFAYQAGLIGYINPSYDRYSNLSAGVSQRLPLGDRQNLTLGTGFNWALDQNTTLQDIEQQGQGSDVTLQARLELGDFTLGATQVVGDLLPNSQASRTVLDAAFNLGPDLRLAGFWTPFNNAASAPQYGLAADIALQMGSLSPHLVVSWQNTLYRYGADLLGNALSTRSNTVEVQLKLDW
ncbi:hypothetical protein IQ265_17085 [Nodosilinea sp. LEGE 06152]|uniref:hypothetical protein n=1 Tax=Nodosilinea sp. LEGE 06152 TaxID=2777966 RepID=UPI00187F2F3D|nr:hypothetical protein [Nodosilinea sp. LEGE 06152]MBE9158535.1 hypothetical protein [Nodosilinea sp. LEGE 06152]